MSAIALAIIGKNDKPIYMKEFANEDVEAIMSSVPEEALFGLLAVSEKEEDRSASSLMNTSIDCSLRQQFILHAALDRFEQLAGPHSCGWREPGVTGNAAMFVGLLYPIEDMRVYGYMTTTQIKFLLTVEDDAAYAMSADETIKRLFVKIHRFYVEYTLNPFSPLEGPIESERFDKKVRDCIVAYNHTMH
jgi:hypothetical protein